MYPYVRCLFCETGYEERVIRLIEASDGCCGLFPRKIKRIFRAGKWTEELKALLPGYVFLFSETETPVERLLQTEHVLRVLRYDGEPDGYLKGTDRELADMLLRQGGVVGVLEAVKIGSWIEITDGLLKQYHGKVVRMVRRKRMALIQLDIVGHANQVWLSYECIEPLANQKEQTLSELSEAQASPEEIRQRDE